MAALVIVTGIALYNLWTVSTDRATNVRRELFQRDLRDLVSRFDADERYVIENNVVESLDESRRIAPLLLPRQYYLGLPAGQASFTPRQPPRNCFLRLVPTSADGPFNDSFCPYFSENPLLGKYLFMSAVFEDSNLVPLRVGDSRINADALRVKVSFRAAEETWWLAFQVSPFNVAKDRYELTAFREVSANQKNRDRKIEGWAYVQPQADGRQQIYVIARLDFKEFLLDEPDQPWPPLGWRDTSIDIQRRDASDGKAQPVQITYQPKGSVDFSLSTLSSQIFGSYGSLGISRETEGVKESWDVKPPATMREKLQSGWGRLKVTDGNLLISWTPTVENAVLPDTTLSLSAIHPWLVVEKGFWQTTLYLVALLIGGTYAIFYFQKQILVPLAALAKHSDQLSQAQTSDGIELPYGERKNEIGILTQAINGLIRNVRDQTTRIHAERANRELEGIRNRARNLQVVGHEIRSPLQALIALHPDASDPSRRHIDRMMEALPHLLGGMATADAIKSRHFTPETLDIAIFLSEVAANASHQDILNVTYTGPSEGIFSNVDDGALEDALTNILANANRERFTGSDISILLERKKETAVIEIFNQGPPIPADVLPQIFDFGFSTSNETSSRQRGVGLYVAQSYIEAMSGSIAVENRGDGVAFVISLPITDEATLAGT